MRKFTRREFGSMAAGLSAAAMEQPARAQAADGPIRIGYTLPLSGGLAGNGKPAALAHKLWLEDINAKGGLLGRKVELVNYDDQSNRRPDPGALHEADRSRQGRSRRLELCDRAHRAGDADRHEPRDGLRHAARLRRPTTSSNTTARRM